MTDPTATREKAADSPVTLLIVDDHPVVRDGLRGMVGTASDIRVIGEAGDGQEAIELAATLDPDVILMDLRMPVMGGVAAITALRARGARCGVLVLTTFDADSDVLSAIQAGATGYLLKDAPVDELLRAVRSAARGEATLSPAVAGRLMSRVATPAPAPDRSSPLSQDASTAHLRQTRRPRSRRRGRRRAPTRITGLKRRAGSVPIRAQTAGNTPDRSALRRARGRPGGRQPTLDSDAGAPEVLLRSDGLR
ncbi:MAG: LuxR family transcriptional regulator [Frankiales bacterium]|nr:LuxR family transcriptional regulator [Frankiales bacterium]